MARGGTGTGVVEDAPGVDRVDVQRGGEAIEGLRRVWRKIRARRPVPPVVDQPGPAARSREASRAWRIGGDPRDPVLDQQSGRGLTGPGRMARLTYDRSGVERSQQREEPAGAARLESEGRRQLHEQRTEVPAEAGDLAEEPSQRFARPAQRALVGDEFRDLDGEAERCGHRVRPALVDRRGVRAIEGGVDLGGVQPTRIAVKLRALVRETVAMGAGNVPAGAADVRAHVWGESKKKPDVTSHVGLFEKMPAATYSPTQFPMQYHRRYEA